jgi:hypothetical protein
VTDLSQRLRRERAQHVPLVIVEVQRGACDLPRASRWHIEECFQQGKNEAGLGHYQVRSWRAWYAHITLSMLALAWLSAARAQAAKGEPPPAAQA